MQTHTHTLKPTVMTYGPDSELSNTLLSSIGPMAIHSMFRLI